MAANGLPRPAGATDREAAAIAALAPTIRGYINATNEHPTGAWRTKAYAKATQAALDAVRAFHGDTSCPEFAGYLNEEMTRAVWGIARPVSRPPVPRRLRRRSNPQPELHTTQPQPHPQAEPHVQVDCEVEVESDRRPLHDIIADVPADLDADTAAARIVATLAPEDRDRHLTALLAALITEHRPAPPADPPPDRRQRQRQRRPAPTRQQARESLFRDMFPLPDGTLVPWETATADQHRARAAWLRKRADDDLDAARSHDEAAAAIEAAGVACLADLDAAAI